MLRLSLYTPPALATVQTKHEYVRIFPDEEDFQKARNIVPTKWPR